MIFPENRAVYELNWKNMVEPDRSQMTIWRMGTACWIPKATSSTQNMQHLLLCHCKNRYANVSLCYVCRYFACLVILDDVLKHIDTFKLITSPVICSVAFPLSS